MGKPLVESFEYLGGGLEATRSGRSAESAGDGIPCSERHRAPIFEREAHKTVRQSVNGRLVTADFYGARQTVERDADWRVRPVSPWATADKGAIERMAPSKRS